MTLNIKGDNGQMLKLEHRRSDIEVIADILREGEGSKTEIMYDVGLSYYQLERYMRRLLELRLIHKKRSGQNLNYKITRKGQHLLEEIDVLLTMLKEETNPNPSRIKRTNISH